MKKRRSVFKYFRDRTREKLVKRPFPPEWMLWVEQDLKWFSDIQDAAERARVLDHLKVFVWEKEWIGAGGLEVTTRHEGDGWPGKAARLSRNIGLHAYDRLTELVLYPDRYARPGQEGVYLGEAHSWGTVVLSWRAVEDGLAAPHDGHDTTIHELAHVLDRIDGSFDGVPDLHHLKDYKLWQRTLSHYFAALREDPEQGVVREYGALNPAEFFAVATEMFFEKPRTLYRAAPDLYQVLRRFYRVSLLGHGERHVRTTRHKKTRGGKPRD